MKKQWRRLLLAAVISSSVFGVTWYWYQFSEQKISSESSEKPLAYVGKVVDDIQRRPAARLLWQEVNSGEPLYNGEAVRTSDRGEVRIQFADSDRYLDLEPESLIVIKKSEGEIALDLMEGSLFVNAKAESEKDAPGLVLNSASGKVDLSKASASLSKGSGNSVDVQVLEGQASMVGADGKSKEIKQGSTGLLGASGFQFDKNSLKILSPLPQKPLAMDADDLKPVQFKWQGFPPNSHVSLWTGSTRKNLKEVATADLNRSELSTKVSFGRHFWKLVAKNDTGAVIAESSIYRTEVVARYAPTVTFPTADAVIPALKSPFDITFKWQKSEDTEKITLDIWSDPELKHKVISQSFTGEDSFLVPSLKDGTYYWRMSSYFVDSEAPMLGKVQKFSVKPEAIARAEAQAALTPIQVGFTMPENQLTQYYVGAPQVGLTWSTNKLDQVAFWRVKLHAEDEAPMAVAPVEVKDTKFSTTVAKPGRYIASIQAINKDGLILGTSTSQPVVVAPLPRLKSPQFYPTEGMLQATMDGRTQLKWEAISGAKEYWLTIRKDGKELRKAKYDNNFTALKNLLPGEYQVEVTAVDQYGRSSDVSPTRTLQVPDKSGVKAPTLKKIKVN
ncbi:FecR protein [compost metagenome]